MSLLGRKMDKISIDNYASQPIGSETLINIHIQIMRSADDFWNSLAGGWVQKWTNCLNTWFWGGALQTQTITQGNKQWQAFAFNISLGLLLGNILQPSFLEMNIVCHVPPDSRMPIHFHEQFQGNSHWQVNLFGWLKSPKCQQKTILSIFRNQDIAVHLPASRVEIVFWERKLICTFISYKL